MKLFTKTFALISPLALLLMANGAFAKDFGQADLERIVGELDKVLPENPGYKYPIRCLLVDDPQVNANAGFVTEGGFKQARMVVYTGFVKGVHGDERLIRACVAHELSHLTLGHSLTEKPAAQDLYNLWIRQQEYAADKSGAEALEKTGHSRKDMVDLLLYLGTLQPRDGDWLDQLTADHADPLARAAEVSASPEAMKAMVAFDTGLAYEDARSHLYARALFELAAKQWPSLTEAYVNSGKCALLYYYDNLPDAVRAAWWRPDFGSLITDPHAASAQSPDVTDQDREAYKDAMVSINLAVEKNPGSVQAQELLALARVLEPDAKKPVVQQGIDWFTAQAAKPNDDATNLRYANNAGVGYQRLADLTSAYKTIIAAQKKTTNFNLALGENLGLVVVADRSKEDDLLAANVMFTWLTNSPKASPRWQTVKKTFDGVLAKQGLESKQVEAKAAYLCAVVSLNTSGHELGILLPTTFFVDTLGKPDVATSFTNDYPDLMELSWHQGKVTAYTERTSIMRITSYEDGAYLLLKPVDKGSSASLQIKVGMSKADLFAMLDEKSAVEKLLSNAGQAEKWLYFPSLNMGVYIAGGVVKGITVSPVIQP